MADNHNKCPLCGKHTHEEETFCRDCQEIAQNAYPDELLNRREIEEILEEEGEELIEEASANEQMTSESDVDKNDAEPIVPVRRKSNRKLLIFVFLGLAIMLIVGATGSYVYVKDRESEATQMAYWNICIDENTPLAYSKYLVRYPEGKFVKEAQDKIMELREKENKEWYRLRNSNNVDALFAFLKDHPETPYAREINNVIDSLSWVATLKQNTAVAYQTYIENVKLERFAGNYIDLAQEKYDYLSQLKTLEGDELKVIKTLLVDFFKSLSSTDKKDIEKQTTPVLTRFYAATNQPNETITDSIKKVLKSQNIKSITYTPNVSEIEVIQDNKGIYFTTLPVREEIVFTTRKKKKEFAGYTVKTELSKDKLIQLLYKTK